MISTDFPEARLPGTGRVAFGHKGEVKSDGDEASPQRVGALDIRNPGQPAIGLAVGRPRGRVFQ